MSFLWHKVGEKEKEEIREQAKEIMNSFSKRLSLVKDKIGDFDSGVVSLGREDGKGQDSDLGLKKRILENAPDKNEDFIIAEKKKW